MNEAAPLLLVHVNGDPCRVPRGASLADLLTQLGHASESVATAVNGEFVARGLRHTHVLAEGDQLQCFRPIVGG